MINKSLFVNNEKNVQRFSEIFCFLTSFEGSLDKKSKKAKSTTSSPRDESPKRDQSPKIKVVAVPVAPKILCPRCKTSSDVVRLGLWREKDTIVYFCGMLFGNDRACRNIWTPDYLHLQIDEVNMRYLPGPDGDYYVTFKSE